MRPAIFSLFVAAVVPGLAVLSWGQAAAAAPVRQAHATGVNRQILSDVQDLDVDSYYQESTDAAAEASSSPVEQVATAGSCGRGYVAVNGLCGENQSASVGMNNMMHAPMQSKQTIRVNPLCCAVVTVQQPARAVTCSAAATTAAAQITVVTTMAVPAVVVPAIYPRIPASLWSLYLLPRFLCCCCSVRRWLRLVCAHLGQSELPSAAARLPGAAACAHSAASLCWVPGI
jgi:hypothetical protein